MTFVEWLNDLKEQGVTAGEIIIDGALVLMVAISVLAIVLTAIGLLFLFVRHIWRRKPLNEFIPSARYGFIALLFEMMFSVCPAAFVLARPNALGFVTRALTGFFGIPVEA